MTKESPATKLLLDMTDAIIAKDTERFRELLSKKVITINCIKGDEYLQERYIAVLTNALEFNIQQIEELEGMITNDGVKVGMQGAERGKLNSSTRSRNMHHVIN